MYQLANQPSLWARFYMAVRAAAFRILMFVCGLCSFATSAQAEINITFGTYAADKPTDTVRKFKPFLRYLADEMSVVLDEPVTINMDVTSDYDDGIEQLVTGRVDFARFGPASYIIAKERNENIAILAMESQAGKKTFKGVIAVHEDSTFKTLSDLKGNSFAFGNSLSTIGRYLSQDHLLSAGITGDMLSGYAYLGRHDKVGTAVGNRSYDAGALKSSTFEKLQKENVPIRMLFEFDNVTKPWLVRDGLEPRIVDAMRHVMLNASNEDAIKAITKYGFLVGEDSDFALVRAAMKNSSRFDP